MEPNLGGYRNLCPRLPPILCSNQRFLTLYYSLNFSLVRSEFIFPHSFVLCNSSGGSVPCVPSACVPGERGAPRDPPSQFGPCPLGLGSLRNRVWTTKDTALGENYSYVAQGHGFAHVFARSQTRARQQGAGTEPLRVLRSPNPLTTSAAGKEQRASRTTALHFGHRGGQGHADPVRH